MRSSFVLLKTVSTMAPSKAPLTALKDLRVSSNQIPAFGLVPNTSIQKKPLFSYHSAFYSSTSASAIESHLSAVGVVSPQVRIFGVHVTSLRSMY